MRSSTDGTGPGLPIPVFGGLHGDLPLVPEGGALLAELVVEENLTCVLDVSEFGSKAAQMRFLTDFAERLFRLHGRRPQPRHLFLEEADEYLPQRVMRDQARCVGAWSKLVKQGRHRGLGITLVSQRSAVVNKDALTQVETLIALRSTSPQDRRAILGWVDYHAVARELVDSLPSLADGEAWVCSPHWLGKVERSRFRQRRTFDSGATPVFGPGPRPATIADIDLRALSARMAGVVARAERDDPAALRRRVDALEAELEAARRQALAGNQPPSPEPERIVEWVEVPVPDPGLVERAERAVAELGRWSDRLGGPVEEVVSAARDLGVALARAKQVVAESDGRRLARSRRALSERPVRGNSRQMSANADLERPSPVMEVGAERSAGSHLKAGARRLLETLARHHPLRVTKAQLGTLAGFKVSGGTFATYYGTLRREGLIEVGRDGLIGVTPAGLAEAGIQVPRPMTTEEILETWRRALKKGARDMLDLLVVAHPEAMTRDELGSRLAMATSGGTFSTYLGTLRRNGLIEVDGQRVKAADSLFLPVG